MACISRSPGRPTRAALAVLALAGLAGLGGCAATVVQGLPTLDCPVAPELMQARCAAPQPLPPGTTYGQLLQAAQGDRQALADCRAREAALIGSVQACQQAIGRYNQQIADINRAANAPK